MALSAKARSYGRIVDYGDGPEYEGFTRLPVSRKQEGYNKKLGDKDFSAVLGPLSFTNGSRNGNVDVVLVRRCRHVVGTTENNDS